MNSSFNNVILVLKMIVLVILYTLVSCSSPETIKISKMVEDTKSRTNYFFYEDFSRVREGTLPTGWVGGDNMVIGKVGRENALYLTPTQNIVDVVGIPNIIYPENFDLTFRVTIPNSCWGNFKAFVGPVMFGNKCCRIIFNEDEIQHCDIGTNALFTIRKRENVFSVYLNGKQTHLKRINSYEMLNYIRLQLEGTRGSVIIHSVIGINLDPENHQGNKLINEVVSEKKELAMKKLSESFNGNWQGNYACSQGETGLTLTINSSEAGKLKATFSFYALPSNINVKSGSFTMEGTYDSNGNFTLNAKEWINRPANYIMVDMSGKLDLNNNRLIGNITHQSCYSFELSKVD